MMDMDLEAAKEHIIYLKGTIRLLRQGRKDYLRTIERLKKQLKGETK